MRYVLKESSETKRQLRVVATMYSTWNALVVGSMCLRMKVREMVLVLRAGGSSRNASHHDWELTRFLWE